MKTRMLRKAVATTVAATMVLSVPVYAKEDKKVTIDQIELGKDYTDIKADLKFLTHKTEEVWTSSSLLQLRLMKKHVNY